MRALAILGCVMLVGCTVGASKDSTKDASGQRSTASSDAGTDAGATVRSDGGSVSQPYHEINTDLLTFDAWRIDVEREHGGTGTYTGEDVVQIVEGQWAELHGTVTNHTGVPMKLSFEVCTSNMDVLGIVPVDQSSDRTEVEAYDCFDPRATDRPVETWWVLADGETHPYYVVNLAAFVAGYITLDFTLITTTENADGGMDLWELGGYEIAIHVIPYTGRTDGGTSSQ